MVHCIAHSRLLLLPSELKHLIAELSSHGTLASLARTHTALQREAEQTLYRILSNPSSKCLETLATNSEKAGFVHFLTVDFDERIIDDRWRATREYLLNALVNMHRLSDFRLRLPASEGHNVQPWIESLDKILCNDHFRLQTLCCDKALDLSRITTSQSELKKLGIYVYDGYDLGLLGTLKQLQNAQLRLPVVFALEYGSYFGVIFRIGIFPPFYDCHPTVHQVLAETFDVNQNSYMLADVRDIDGISIYLVDSCDLSSIQVLAKSMSVTFPRIISLTFWFQNPCEKIVSLLFDHDRYRRLKSIRVGFKPSREIKKIISLFPNLSMLDFEVWPPLHTGDGNISGDVKRAHEALAKDWVLACPELVLVSFIDGSMLEKEGGSWN